jgi:DNA-binding NarL/FixJ family response regulator
MDTQTHDMRAQPHAPARRQRSRPLRVVIVEDSERILTHLAEELSAVDNVCIAGTAATEAQARELLAKGHWDLAILDLQLREGNGLRVLKAIREEAPGAGTIAVFTITHSRSIASAAWSSAPTTSSTSRASLRGSSRWPATWRLPGESSP